MSESTGLRDVAALAGVSAKTVSNVMHGRHHKVSAATRARVEAAIAELDYRPNLPARRLREGRTRVVRVALPDPLMPYFAELTQHIVESAHARDHRVVIDPSALRRQPEPRRAGGPRPWVADGLIASPVTDWAPSDTPVILLGEEALGVPGDHVLVDNVAAARMATEHLVGRGRRRIATIGATPDPAVRMSRLRFRGYADALRAADLAVDPRLHLGCARYHAEDGARATAALLDRGVPFDGLFCSTDLLALGALYTLRARGIRVPEEVAVVGIDGIDQARYAAPSLTTVVPDKAQIARLAVDTLLRRIDAPSRPAPREQHAGLAMAVRESSGRTR